MNLHPTIADFEFLIGSWEGNGEGHYPTITPFRYREVLTFTATPGKPFLYYVQKTFGLEDQPMHTESGYLRPIGDGRIEFTLAQPTGQTELLEGTVGEEDDGTITITLDTSTVVNTSSAKQVDSTNRAYAISPDRTEMVTEFGMAAVGEPMQQHLLSNLTKANER